MKSILEKLFAAADNHAADTEEQDHAVGDLHALLTRAWQLMTVEQKQAFLGSCAVSGVLDTGAREEFSTSDLQRQLTAEEGAPTANRCAITQLRNVERWMSGYDTRPQKEIRQDIRETLKLLGQPQNSVEQIATAPEETRQPKVVVLCSNSEGAPEFHTCRPEVTSAQIEAGEHYELAKENAEFNSYSGPMLAFDALDPAAKQLENVAAWLKD